MSKKPKPDPKAKRPAPPGHPKTDGVHLPILVEATFTFARIMVVLIAGVEAALSIKAGCPIGVVALRTGVAVATIGLGLWLISWIVSGGFLENTPASPVESAPDASPAPSSTIQMNA